MLRDVFYFGKKPNVHPRERPAKNLEEARLLARTEHFWIVNEFCDYTGFDWDFDFDFLPDTTSWHGEHNNAWPSIYQKDSGTWLCPKEYSQHTIYRDDVKPLKRFPDMTNWVLLDKVDKNKFDFAWHPDPTEPPFTYKWGCKFFEQEVQHVLEYRTPGAFQEKWVEGFVELEPNTEYIVEVQEVDKTKWDISWRPDPREPAYIYIWGNKYIDGTIKSTWEYHTPGATEKKYMSQLLEVVPEYDRWVEVEKVDRSSFDFSWRPDPREPAYIYVWGNKYYSGEYGATLEYHTPGATERKYMTNDVGVLPLMENYKILQDVENFDFCWRPNPKDPPYIYVFGNQYYPAEIDATIEYHTPGATERKYVNEIISKVKPNPSKFTILHPIDTDTFDFAWRPNPKDPPYIYVFGNQWRDAVKMPTVLYKVEGATEYKYITDVIATLAPNKKNWKNLEKIDDTGFDYSWVPDPNDPPYIYEFGTQWQKCGGPQYVVENATQKKYIDTMKAVRLPNPTGFQIAEGVMIKSFDFSWHPDETEEPYIYVFGNNLYPGKIMPTVRYVIPGATNVKFIDEVVATLAPNINNWVIPDNVDISSTNFDFSWIPNPKDPPYIYEFGTQWQKNGGPKFIVEGATERKYIDFKVQVKPTTEHWHIESELKIKLFDYSWHPDTTEEPYIYVFGNNQYPAEIMPTIKYIVPGATEVKYVHDIVATLDQDMTNWIYPNSVDIEKFDFSWKPNPKDPPYIYKFGTQWQKNGGPNYVVEGATEIKYVDTQQAVRMPDKNNWTIPKYIDVESFDFSWHPDESEPAYIYEFGTQWQKNGGPRYVVPGATEIKYIDTLRATALPDKNNWFIPNNIDESSFDFNWHPDSTEEPYIYEFATIWNDRGGPRYIVPGATEKKYITDIKARTTPTRDNWNIVIPIEETKFDFSWVPHPEAPPYIYVFGNQWNRSEKETTVEYIVPGATEKKYIDNIVARVSQDKSKFKILHPIIETSFDFSWRPDPYDDPYIYVFGNNRYSGELMPTVEYHVENATERKYIEKLKATLGPTTKHWHKLLPVDDTLFDYSWVPNPKDPPYIYVFGSQWHDPTIESALEYRVPDATEYKYVKDVIATILPDKTNYKILIPIVEGSFDFSWRPNPKDPPYIYVFGNQWFSAEKEATIEYHVEGATERKYMNDFIAEVAEDFSNWEIPESVTVDTFDFSWRPDPGNPPYIYQFGTLDNDNDGPRYIHPNNTGEVVRLMRVERKDVIINDNIPKYYIETDLDDLIDEHKNEIFWALNKNINYDNFDFNWRPSIEKARYIHVFGSPESELTQTYFVSGKMYQLGHRSFNFVEEDKKADSEYLATLFKPSDVFFIDRNNPESNERFEKLKLIFPNITKTRYLNSWVDTIQRCIKRSSTQLAWILNSELDYTNFNFKYYPNPWQMKMVHVFGTQWSHWGTTFMVNKDTFAEDTKYIKIIEHLSNLNFVKTHAAVATNCLYDMYIIDHGNKQLEEVVEICKQKAGSKNVEVIKYEKSYLDTFKRILTMVTPAKENYIWITSSVCNYGNFDFSFICDPFAKDNLHVFPSNFQKFGDTFLVDVNKLQSLVDDMNLLEDYGKIQYAYQQRAERYPAPVFVTEEDTHRNSTKFEFDFPYAIVKTKDNENLDINYTKPISLWTDESKNIEILSTGGTALVLPKEVKNYVTEELYDYPYISKIDTLSKSRPLDIVFLSNGESVADKHFDYLLKITKGLQNRVVRVDGVNGRAAAYHAAAEASNTPWFFAVFAKLEVNNRFNFNWQPDRLQVSKHYIFNALNPVNGLTYGHQAMIAYNKKLVLNNPGRGLDFTLDDEHEVVDLLSGIARFNTDKFSTWRTAFREVIKLKSDYKDVSYDRLQTWLNKAEGDYAEDCLLGAKDGVEYYNQVGGDIEKLKLSYEWEWLNSYYRGKYK